MRFLLGKHEGTDIVWTWLEVECLRFYLGLSLFIECIP